MTMTTEQMTDTSLESRILSDAELTSPRGRRSTLAASAYHPG